MVRLAVAMVDGNIKSGPPLCLVQFLGGSTGVVLDNNPIKSR